MQQADKIRLLTAGRDLPASQGLEIGARDAPLIARDAGPVLYADYTDAASIRANTHDPAVDKAKIVEVDIVTGGGSLAAVLDRQVDYVVASHVAEHVPDLLGWLADIHKVLAPGGTLGLGIPDRRFTFDRCRPESTIAEAVEAWLLQYDRPSPRRIVDSAWQSFDISVAQGWRGEIPPSGALARRQERLAPALELVQRVRQANAYNDAHCWVFTPASFLALMEQAAILGLLPYVLEIFHPTEAGGYEFFAVLRKAQGDHAAATLASIAAAQSVLAGWQAEAEFAAAHVPDEVAGLRAEVAALRESLAVMRASRIWRMVAPLRRLKAVLRG